MKKYLFLALFLISMPLFADFQYLNRTFASENNSISFTESGATWVTSTNSFYGTYYIEQPNVLVVTLHDKIGKTRLKFKTCGENLMLFKEDLYGNVANIYIMFYSKDF